MMPLPMRALSTIESPVAIQACRLSKAYGGRPVLVDLDLDIAAGQCVALTGANGAGKTTLLNCLASLLRPDSGEVRWLGRLVGRDVGLHRSMGMVAHESGLYSHLSLRENLLFAARLSGADKPGDRADHWLNSTGLAPHADALPTRLSRGMRQRLALARALIHDPPLLLLDEPFTCLDAAGGEWLFALLADLCERGRTVCFVAHEPKEIQRLAHRVIEMREGKVYDVTTICERHTRRAA